jgi:hypothetical protein
VDPRSFKPAPSNAAPQQRQQQAVQPRAAPIQQPAPNYNNRVQPRNNTNNPRY